MTTKSKTRLTIGVLTLGCIASAAFWQPHPGAAVVEPETAPVLGAVYAPAPEEAETRVLARGQTLGHMLDGARLSAADLSDLLLTLRQFSDPRRMASGTEITIRRWVGSGLPRAVDIRLNSDSTLRLAKDGLLGWHGEVVETPVVVDTLYVEETIDAGQSIWQALFESEDPSLPVKSRDLLVGHLAQVYEFKLDLRHDIMPGDRFRFSYERETRPDGSARAVRILAAEFDNRGTPFPAVLFETEDGEEYFDLRGHSLRNAFRRYPLDFVRVTSSFAWRRYHPVLGIYRAHVGTDFGAKSGTPVLATGSGVVEFAGRRGGYGNLVILRHPNGYKTRYAHLRGFARGVRGGLRVQQGQVIGYVGATGTVTAPHLHYEFHKDGRPVDPRAVKLPASLILPDRHRPEFERRVKERLAVLERGAAERTRLAGGAGSRPAAPAAGGP